MAIDAALWQRLSALLDEALALPDAERAAWLAALHVREPELAQRLEPMLADASASDDAMADTVVLPTAPRIGGLTEFTDGLAAVFAVPELTGTRLGAWQLEQRIGEGGMGEVWLARRVDGLYEAQAAIKLLRSDLPAGALAARFARERALLARLDHPAIARLLDAGVANGQAFLVLELVRGQTLSEHVRAQVPTVAERVQLLLAVARAVAHAHAQLIVHRDLKPSNVMVDERGQPKLLDFGIAALLDDPAGAPGDGDLTRQTGRGLTVAYAAPEQVTGGAIGTAADVFSLGVMLFELLSGALPFMPRQASRAAAEYAVLHNEPKRLREAARGEDAAAPGPGRPQDVERAFGDLEAVALKALRKQPAERYGSVGELIEDLERWLGHRPVSVRRENWRHNTRLWFKRHAMLASAMSVTALALTAGLALATWQWQRAEEARQQSQAVTSYLTDMLASASPDRHGGQWPTVLKLLEDSRQRIDQRFADAPLARISVLETMVVTYRHLNRFDLSMPLAEQWVALARQHFGAEDPRTLAALAEQARQYQIQGLFDRAIDIAEPLVPLLRRHRSTAAELRNTLYLLSTSYTRTGRDSEAEPLLMEAGELTLAAFGPNSHAYASHLNSLQVLRNGQGRMREALQAMEQTQPLWVNPPIERQRDVLVWRRNTLAIQSRLALYDGWEQRAQALLQDMDRLIGRGNDMALGMRHEVARMSMETGQFQRAHQQRQDNLAYAAEGAMTHPALTVPLRALALMAAAQAQAIDVAALNKQARALLQEIAEHAQRIGHPRSEAYVSLARAALALDDAALARLVLERMSADTGLRLATDTLLSQRKMQLDGQLARLEGDLAASRRLLQARRDLFDRTVERRWPAGWATAMDLAYTLVLLNDAGAAAALDDARSRRPPTMPADHPLDRAEAYLRSRLALGAAHEQTRGAQRRLLAGLGPTPAGSGQASLFGMLF